MKESFTDSQHLEKAGGDQGFHLFLTERITMTHQPEVFKVSGRSENRLPGPKAPSYTPGS